MTDHAWGGSVALATTNLYDVVDGSVVAQPQKASCPHASEHAIWVGLGGTEGGLLQDGIVANQSLEHYNAWWETDPANNTGHLRGGGRRQTTACPRRKLQLGRDARRSWAGRDLGSGLPTDDVGVGEYWRHRVEPTPES
jgi:hypothetical protein